MSDNGRAAICRSAAVAIILVLGCGSEAPPWPDTAAIRFETRTLPPGDAGRLYSTVVAFATEGGAALPDRFELAAGALPPGVALDRDREDRDGDGVAEADAAFTGHARLRGIPRERGTYAFTIKAISTGGLAGDTLQPDLAVAQAFSLAVGEGRVAILTPTAEEGTSNPAVPAFPGTVPFVNPANPEAFFSFAFEIAGGSNDNAATVYAPREWELSAFDASVTDEPTLHADTEEAPAPGAPSDPFEQDFRDGGVFVLQSGRRKVQLGGYPSPRGPVMEDRDGDGVQETPFLASLRPGWFQDAAVPRDSRRQIAEAQDGDATLGTPLPVLFADYFDPGYRSTTPPSAAKYPFAADQYLNAFFVPFVAGEDLSPLAYRLIVEAVDRRGTPGKADDVIARKAYVVRVEIPDIVFDTVLLPSGQAGVSYAPRIAVSGGVPPLFTDLEWVDGTADLAATAADPLTKGLLGVEVEPRTGQFLGAPRASGTVELTVRAWAHVMNPAQSGAPVPTGSAGERDGSIDPDGPAGPAPGKPGRHRTYPVDFAMPVPPSVANASLHAGFDGQAYPGDRIRGAGGAPMVVPYPVGFFEAAPGATYPSSAAQRAYDWDAEHAQDASYAPGATVAGLPNDLSLVRSAAVATNGAITGITLDRGFHVVRFTGRDAYVGPSAAPHPIAHRVTFEKALVISVSPDHAVYLRGVGAHEAPGGVPVGLADAAAQMAEPQMTPILLAAGLFTVETGKSPVFHGSMPAQMDMLPVMLANGGSDAHNRMSIPQVRGYWPAESNKEARWEVSGNQAWKHLQQEFTWLQAPDKEQTRVFLWAEAVTTKTFANAQWTQKYQQLDPTKRRGVLVAKPLTGEFFVPAILDGNVADHGVLFGAEAVVSGGSVAEGGPRYSYGDRFYTKLYYYAVRDSAHDREAHLHGGGTYLQTYASTSDNASGWYMQSLGRTATSVAMSADGVWCATVLVGGSNVQKILLWRTDRQQIPDRILAQPHAIALDGRLGDGTPFPSSACILKVGGQGASGKVLSKNQRHLLPDSLLFVENGLLFLNETQLDRVFGVSLLDGHLSSVDLNAARTQVNGGGIGPSVSATTGQFVPDQDYLRGQGGAQGFGAQFAFAGDRPDPGEEGPDRVAFVAGSNAFLGALTDLAGYPRQGYAIHANRDKALLFLDLDTGNGGLDLGTSTLRDLTGSDPDVYGDLLTPGRTGEELDYLALSDDGEYAAVVRDIATTESMPSSAFGYRPTFHTALAAPDASGDAWTASHDLLLVSTGGADLDQGAGSRHVLHLGTGSLATTDPAGMPAYAAGRAHLNASFRRLNGLTFAADGRTLVFNYAGHNQHNPLYFGGTATGWAPHNPEQIATHAGTGTQSSLSVTFRTASGGAIDFGSSSNLANNLAGIPATGATTAPFGQSTSRQNLWATFKSPNGCFLYYVSDQVDASLSFTEANRNFMVGFNTSAETIGVRSPYTPFVPHPGTVGFAQFDCNSWNYESRFAASPGTGILCVVASDASAGAGSATDLEVYAMDADLGTDLVPLTSAVTTGTANAINHLCLSADGNVLAGQVSRTAASSASGRAFLNGNSDLFVVKNVREAVLGETPDAFVVSEGRSHGASLAFVGECSLGGPQALVFSSGPSGATNMTWATRTLLVAPLVPGATATPLDHTPSHHAVLAAGRKEDDDATSAK
jgi:hypothetical protein